MTSPLPDSEPAHSWLRPQVESAGLRQYLQVIRERIWIVVAAVAISLAGAVLYLAMADKVYEAEADILVAPISSDDALLVSLGLIRQSGEPTRDVETAARLASSIAVAERAKAELDSPDTPESLLEEVTVEPVAQSNLISIVASGPTPEAAAELANAFADGVIDDRSEALVERIDEILPQLTSRLESETPGVAPAEGLRSEISRLEFLREAGDPTVRVEVPATPPTAASSPRPALTLGAALFVGLVLGLGGAFAAQALDPRLRREEQLRSNFSLPILARIPRDRPPARGRALVPGRIAPPTMEAYRTLRANIAAGPSAEGRAQSLLITGSAPREGKTSTALNLAAAFALAGDRVILIEADLRRPAIADALGVKVRKGVASVLLDNVPLEEALTTTPQLGPDLAFLLADDDKSEMSELFSLRAAERLLEKTARMADYVIFDSPPLTAVVDTMPLARSVDDVLIVSRLGLTRLDRLRELAELLASNGISPVGFALVGTQAQKSNYYYEAAQESAPEPGEVDVDEPRRAAIDRSR